MEDYPKILIFMGLLLLAVGLLWQFAGKYFMFGKLPGDITIDKGNFKMFFPLGTSLAISIIATMLFVIYRAIFR